VVTDSVVVSVATVPSVVTPGVADVVLVTSVTESGVVAVALTVVCFVLPVGVIVVDLSGVVV